MQYPTDDGNFKSIPKDMKKYIFSFLRGSPIVSLVCKSFRDDNKEFLNGKSLLELMQGQIYKIMIRESKSLRNLERFYDTTLVHNVTEDVISKFSCLLEKKASDRGFVSLSNSPLFYDFRSHISLSIKEEKIHEFLAYIDGLKIKSNCCEIDMGLGLEIENLVKCSMM